MSELKRKKQTSNSSNSTENQHTECGVCLIRNGTAENIQTAQTRKPSILIETKYFLAI